MNESKRIIVEFGARRQQFSLSHRPITIRKLRNLIGNRFDLPVDENASYTLQMYNDISDEYDALDDEQIFDWNKDFESFYRFRIIRKSQKCHLLDNLQSTVGKLCSAAREISQIRDLVGTLNQNCDKLNQLMDIGHSNSFSNSSYLFDPCKMKKDIDASKLPLDSDDDDENLESVSCIDNPPPLIPIMITLKQPQVLRTNNNIQTRIIPCKYAVRGSCHLGDKCFYLHDETCIQSAREWERRL